MVTLTRSSFIIGLDTDTHTHNNNTRSLIRSLLQTPLPKSSVNPNNPVEVVGAVSGELDRVQALVNKEVKWATYIDLSRPV